MIRKAATVVALVVAIVGSVILVAQDPTTTRLDSDVSAQDARFPEYIAAVSDSPLTDGDRYQVLVNGDRVFSAMLDAIASAKRRVNLVSYIYDKEGVVPSEFTEALIAARRRGVEVNLVIDAFGSTISRKDLRRLEEAGCAVGRFHPLRLYALQEASYRNHRKILVVDGRVAFTGGIGIADHWQGNAQDKDHWRDTQFRVEGPAVRHLEAAFYENFAESREYVKPIIGVADDAASMPAAGHARSVIVATSPTGGVGGVKRLFLLSIAAARHTIDITTPYFIMHDSTHWSLEEARRRAAYEELLRDGIDIHEYQPTMMHAKTIVVDGAWSIFGSANFDNRSLDMNEEMTSASPTRRLQRS